MLVDNESSKLAESILASKLEHEGRGTKPRLVLVGPKAFALLEEGWLEDISTLPWGDSLAHELRMRRAQRGSIFLGDGAIFGLWVVKVETIEGFQVF